MTTSMKVDETACHACGIDGGSWVERAPTPGTAHSQEASLGLALSHVERGTASIGNTIGRM